MQLWPLLLLAAAHCLVDTFALIIQPLWPDLQANAGLSNTSIQYVFILWSLATSLSQFVFGYWGDRCRSSCFLWLGPLVAIVCLSAVGLAQSFLLLSLLLLIGGLGIGAFHPEAAAMVGNFAPENRSRAMSIFVMGGAIGLATGPLYSGSVTTDYGLAALVWSSVWGVLLLGAITWGLRGAPAATPPVRRDPVSLRRLFKGRWSAVLLVLVIGTLRVIPSIGVLLALSYMLKERGMTNRDVGWAQCVFQVATGVGVFGCALFVRRTSERLALWLLPLFATPALLLCPTVGWGMLLVLLAFAGLVLGGATPVLISYGQQLLPEGQRVASSITMGVSWGLGGAIVAAIMAIFNRHGRPDMAFYLFAVPSLISSLLCIWLPILEHDRPADPTIVATSERPLATPELATIE